MYGSDLIRELEHHFWILLEERFGITHLVITMDEINRRLEKYISELCVYSVGNLKTVLRSRIILMRSGFGTRRQNDAAPVPTSFLWLI
jgi:hypothetical protein